MRGKVKLVNLDCVVEEASVVGGLRGEWQGISHEGSRKKRLPSEQTASGRFEEQKKCGWMTEGGEGSTRRRDQGGS